MPILLPLVILLLAAPAAADTITFEAGFVDQEVVTSPIVTPTNTVTFRVGAGSPTSDGIIAEAGAPQTAFFPDDQPAGAGAGSYFLTDENALGGTPVETLDYFIEFALPVSSLSLDLYDLELDGNTATLTVYADTARTQPVGSVTETIVGVAPEGLVSNLAVPLPAALIRAARVRTTDPIDTGNGIDNVTFNTVPPSAAPLLPPALWLAFAAALAVGLLAVRRRRVAVAGVLVAALALPACGGSRPRDAVVQTDGTASVVLMDFGAPLVLDPLPAGWFHRTFRRHAPMDISFGPKDGRAAIRLATHDTASMLFRQVDVPLDNYGWLEWDWLVEQGLDGSVDERTVDGDDHPARLFLSFVAGDGTEHAMEIIWGNRALGAGDWKHLTFFGLFSFPHYVANGRAENEGRWHDERVDLRQLFRELWGDPSGARLVEVALFCDTDETGAQSVAYFGKIRVTRNGASAD